MNVLIIGGTRFFGIHTVNRLLENGHTVTIATRGSYINPFEDKVYHLIMDKTDENSVRNVLQNQKYDVVIDKVAYSSNDVRSLLKNICCGRYIQMSSCAVYRTEHLLIGENEYDMRNHNLRWIDRTDDYAEGKRQAERAALEFMDVKDCIFVRYPVVMGVNDYTRRLRFYIEHIMNGIPMFIDKPGFAASYINEHEAGEFLAYLVDNPLSGAVNGCSEGRISQKAIIEYIEAKSNRSAIMSDKGDIAPYNGISTDISYDCSKAESIGFSFSLLHSWIFNLLDSELGNYF